ncbi:MAG: transcription antitermination factor NusB [Bdellovibrionota bacterium]
MNSLSRRQAREIAFQFLYGYLPEGGAGRQIDFSRSEFERFCSNFDQVGDDFAWGLVDGVGKNVPHLDSSIVQLSTNWRIERMPRVDLAILRLAAYEILFCADIPKTVSINEAIEVAKRFGAEDSASFVNGILDKLTKPS